MSPTVESTTKRRRWLWGLVVALAFLFTAALLFTPHLIRRLRPLNVAERNLVGRWVDPKPDAALLIQNDWTFTADKRFIIRQWGKSPIASAGTWFIDNDTLNVEHGNIWRPKRIRIRLNGRNLLHWVWLNAPRSMAFEWESRRIPLDYAPPDLDWPTYPPVPPPPTGE